jgi:hypothetical protein
MCVVEVVYAHHTSAQACATILSGQESRMAAPIIDLLMSLSTPFGGVMILYRQILTLLLPWYTDYSPPMATWLQQRLGAGRCLKVPGLCAAPSEFLVTGGGGD